MCGSSIFTLGFFLRCGLPHDLLECECGLCESFLERLVGWMWMWSNTMSEVVSWRIFYVWMICNEVNVVCHGRIDGCKSLCVECECHEPLQVWLCNYPYVMTWSGLCMNHDDLTSSDACKSKIVIWNGITCPCLHGGASNLIWHGGFCAVWAGNV